MTTAGSIGGTVAPGFEPVARAFADNFTRHDECGAAFAAYVDGRPAVDLWGGEATPGRSWDEGTLALVFSGTKGLVATALLLLADRGALDLEAPVAAYWPAFGARGKQAVTVAELASHRARLPAVRAPLTLADLCEPRRLADQLATQQPEEDPRAATVYHPLTYGWLCGELIRRVDGRTVGQLLAEEIAEPLGLDLWLGLPAELEPRVAHLRLSNRWGSNEIYAPERSGDGLLRAIWANPPLFPPARPLPWNEQRFHRAEIGGANAIGSARSFARLYGCLAAGGTLDGVRLLSEQTLACGVAERVRFQEPFAGDQLVYGVGFQLQNDARAFGPPAEAFGHTGAGGSVHGAWPRERVGFSYAMNEMRDERDGDPRPRSLLHALHESLAASRSQAVGDSIAAAEIVA